MRVDFLCKERFGVVFRLWRFPITCVFAQLILSSSAPPWAPKSLFLLLLGAWHTVQVLVQTL